MMRMQILNGQRDKNGRWITEKKMKDPFMKKEVCDFWERLHKEAPKSDVNETMKKLDEITSAYKAVGRHEQADSDWAKKLKKAYKAKEAKIKIDKTINPLTLVKIGDETYTPTPSDLEAWRKVFEDAQYDKDVCGPRTIVDTYEDIKVSLDGKADKPFFSAEDMASMKKFSDHVDATKMMTREEFKALVRERNPEKECAHSGGEVGQAIDNIRQTLMKRLDVNIKVNQIWENESYPGVQARVTSVHMHDGSPCVNLEIFKIDGKKDIGGWRMGNDRENYGVMALYTNWAIHSIYQPMEVLSRDEAKTFSMAEILEEERKTDALIDSIKMPKGKRVYGGLMDIGENPRIIPMKSVANSMGKMLTTRMATKIETREESSNGFMPNSEIEKFNVVPGVEEIRKKINKHLTTGTEFLKPKMIKNPLPKPQIMGVDWAQDVYDKKYKLPDPPKECDRIVSIDFVKEDQLSDKKARITHMCSIDKKTGEMEHFSVTNVCHGCKKTYEYAEPVMGFKCWSCKNGA
jgi:hypothetical protein